MAHCSLSSALTGLLSVALVLTVFTATTTTAWPNTPMLRGTVIDAATGVKIPNAQIQLEGLQRSVVTDRDGQYQLAAPEGVYTLLVTIPTQNGPYTVQSVNQRSSSDYNTPSIIRTYTTEYVQNYPLLENPYGMPTHRESDPYESEPINLLQYSHTAGEPHILAYELPRPLPQQIRVGRRHASSCQDSEVQEIQTIDLEDYVKGVVPAEIGVFKSVQGGPDAAMESFKTFAIAARSYALWFYARDPNASYHLDDTACNQRYEDDRDPIISQAVDETTGMVLIQAGTTATIDKFEYAASCHHYGSRPEYSEEIIPDPTNVTACVGNWCGHEGCAGHEENPNHPGEGRCLVRGICQWGSVERSMSGDSFESIINHYQPYLEIRQFGLTALTGFVKEDSITNGTPIPDAQVSLTSGEETSTDERGLYFFESLDPGANHLTVSKEGYITLEAELFLQEGLVNWNSVILEPYIEPEEDPVEIVESPDTELADTEILDIDSPDTELTDTEIPDTELADTEIPDSGSELLEVAEDTTEITPTDTLVLPPDDTIPNTEDTVPDPNNNFSAFSPRPEGYADSGYGCKIVQSSPMISLTEFFPKIPDFVLGLLIFLFVGSIYYRRYT